MDIHALMNKLFLYSCKEIRTSSMINVFYNYLFDDNRISKGGRNVIVISRHRAVG